MENVKRKTENNERESSRGQISVFRSSSSAAAVICSACGAEARRPGAKFCLTCGKLLREDYQPLDTLRASYRLQGKNFPLAQPKTEEIENLFEKNENSVSETAWACVVYSFVPYLGILFVPFAFMIGSFGVLVSYRKPYLGGRKLSLASVGLSFVVLVVQIFLWWLLYFIPEIGKQL